MRKIYSLLLLGAFMLLGAQSAWGAISESTTLYLQFGNSWLDASAKICVYFFDNNGGVMSADYAEVVNCDIYSIAVPANANGTVWNKVIVRRCDPSKAAATPSFDDGSEWNRTGDIDLTSESGNCLYGFSFDNTSGNLKSITISTYTAAFTKPSSWAKVYAYVWTDAASGRVKTEPLGGYSSVPEVAADANGVYKISFEMDAAPAGIIWKGTGSDRTDDLEFVDKAVYNSEGIIADHAKNSTQVTGKYYSTFYAPYNVTIPTKDDADADISISAYTGEYNDATSTLTLHALTGVTNVIPGGKAVILKASTAAAYSLKPTTAAAGTAGTNSLLGVTESTTVASLGLAANTKACVLGVENGVVGFYGFTGTLGANKAYLEVPYTAAPTIRFEEDEATDIHNINANESAVKFIKNGQIFIQKNGVVYDVTGRAVK